MSEQSVPANHRLLEAFPGCILTRAIAKPLAAFACCSSVSITFAKAIETLLQHMQAYDRLLCNKAVPNKAPCSSAHKKGSA